MVKVINIDTKTKTIHISNADGDIKTWRTTESGAHFPIKKGESTKEALDKFVEKKRGDRIDEKVPRNLPPELKKKEQESAEAREKLQKDLRKDVFGPAKKESGLLGNRPTPDEQLKTPKAREVYDRLTRYAAEHNKDLQEDDMKHLRSLRDILLDDNNAAEHVEKNFQKWFGSSKQQPAKKEPERSWQRGPRESEDAYFDRREKTMAEARKIDKVSDWYKKAYAGDDAFPKNKDITFDELANKMLDGTLGEFYEAVGVGESDVREKIFQELSERTGRPYDDFYDAWLHGGQKGTSGRAQKQKESIAYMDKLLELNTDMDPDLRKMIVAARDRAKKELKQ